MTRIIPRVTSFVCKLSIVVLCLAFTVTGAVPVSQILSVYEKLGQSGNSDKEILLLQPNPSDVEVQGNMTPTSKADPDQPCLSAVIQPQSETFRSVAVDHQLKASSLVEHAKRGVPASQLRTTVSTISVSLGLQFRLLGEKPSGTS